MVWGGFHVRFRKLGNVLEIVKSRIGMPALRIYTGLVLINPDHRRKSYIIHSRAM